MLCEVIGEILLLLVRGLSLDCSWVDGSLNLVLRVLALL